MELSIISIGNSKGIRLPKPVLEKYGLVDKVELLLERDYIVLKPIHSSRSTWEAAFKKMHTAGHDELLIPDVFDDEIAAEWH
jgi:antitoxin MazE